MRMKYSSTCGGEVEEPEKTADILSSGVTISADEDEILQCDHLNETFYAVLSHGFFYYYNNCNRAPQAVQRRQRPEAKEQWHNDMNPLDARSGLK